MIILNFSASNGCKKGAPFGIVNSQKQTRKRNLLMANLQEIRVHFNKNVKITDNGGDISVDGGLILIKEFLH